MKTVPMPSGKPLEFITVRDQTGRASSLAIGGTKNPHSLQVVGVLPHCSEIVPDSIADADRLIAWLNEWKKGTP